MSTSQFLSPDNYILPILSSYRLTEMDYTYRHSTRPELSVRFTVQYDDTDGSIHSVKCNQLAHEACPLLADLFEAAALGYESVAEDVGLAIREHIAQRRSALEDGDIVHGGAQS